MDCLRISHDFSDSQSRGPWLPYVVGLQALVISTTVPTWFRVIIMLDTLLSSVP